MADADVLLQAGFSVDEVRNHLSSAGFSNDEIRSSLNLADYERSNAVAQAIGQGFFGEFFDEAEAGLKTAEQAVGGAVRDYIVNPVLDIFNKEQVPDRSKTYDQNLAEVRAQEQSYGIEHPYEQLAAKVGGGLLQMATPIGALGQAAKGTSTLGRIVRGGATGAGWGGVYGFGAGEEDIYNRLESAGRGATVGAGFGAAIPAALSVPGAVSRFAGREADDFERALVGHTLAKSGKIDKSPAGKAFKAETGKQIGKREQLFQTLKNSFFKEKVTIKDTPSTVSSKLEDFADEIGEELVNISDDVTKLESKVPLKAGPKLDFSEAKDYASFISKADERKAQIMLDDLADLEAQWNSSPKTFKAIDELRRSAGKRFSTSFKGTGGDEARREFNSEIYSAFKDSIDNYLDTLGKVGGKSDTLSRAKAANAKFTAARTFEQSAFNAANKSLGDKLVGDFIGHRLARPIAYTAGLTGGGPVGAALVAGDAARVLARDVVPVQASKALRGVEKYAGALDIFKALSPKAAAIPTSSAVQAIQKVGGSGGGTPPGGGPGLGFKLSKQAQRNALFDALASKPKQLDAPAITNAAGNPIHGQPRLPDKNWRGDLVRAEEAFASRFPEKTDKGLPIPIFSRGGPVGSSLEEAAAQARAAEPLIKPGTAYEPFERGIVNPKAKIIKPSSKGLTPEEESIFRRAEPKVTPPPTKQSTQKAQLPLEKQPEAQSSIEKLKREIDPEEFDGDLVSDSSFKPTKIQIGSERYRLARDGEGRVTTRAGSQAEYEMGGKATSPRAKLIEWLGLKRESGRVFSSNQLSALERADSGEGLAFKSNGKKYTADSKATKEFLDAFDRKELTKEQFESLSVALRSETKLNGANISPHKTPDVPKDWEEFIKDAPLPESGRVSKTALAALLAAGGVGTSYLPKEKRMEEIKPKDMITAEDLRDAVVYQESRGDATAVSPKGAQGKMQLMPDTGRDLFKRYQKELAIEGIKSDRYAPFDAKQNQFLGTKYVEEMLRIFKDPKLALAGYNAGPGNVRKWMKQYGTTSWDVISAHLKERGAFMETVKYVPSVLAKYNELKTKRG